MQTHFYFYLSKRKREHGEARDAERGEGAERRRGRAEKPKQAKKQKKQKNREKTKQNRGRGTKIPKGRNEVSEYGFSKNGNNMRGDESFQRVVKTKSTRRVTMMSMLMFTFIACSALL